MISPENPAAPWILGLVFLALAATLVVRAIRKDRREYARFKRFRSTLRRQRMFRKWLIDSAAWFGGSSLVVLILAGQFVAPMLQQVQDTNWVRSAREGFLASGLGIGIAIGLVVAALGGGLLAIVLARNSQTVATVGDIGALLPRNRRELGWGAALSVNAGIVEELLFRLGIPALLFGITGNAWVAIAVSLAMFGLLHIYQGVAGIVGSTVIGTALMLLYLATGSIAIAIIVHALIDLRSLVLIPMVVSKAHRVSGSTARRSVVPQ